MVNIYLVEVGEVVQSSNKKNKTSTLQNVREMMSLITNLMQQVSLSVGTLKLDSTCMARINFWVKFTTKI